METYKKEKVVSTFMLEEFNNIKREIHDMVGPCSEKNGKDMDILEKWRNHFKAKMVPFVETVKCGVRTLWIEKFV